jgi:hypothetical protein
MITLQRAAYLATRGDGDASDRYDMSDSDWTIAASVIDSSVPSSMSATFASRRNV